MLSYPLAEALELLTAKLSGAERALENVGEDVEFIREQATIMDVNLARVYNYDVKRCVPLVLPVAYQGAGVLECTRS